MSDIIVFDTSVFVDQLRSARHEGRIASLRGLIRTSSVVLAELWRGVTSSRERDFLRALRKNHPIFTPTEKDWLDSGEILSKIRADLGFTPHKLREFHFDVLVALSACSNGARLITSNRGDFEIIRRYRKFELEIW
jgi:predicted nucleic acid-binding protein